MKRRVYRVRLRVEHLFEFSSQRNNKAIEQDYLTLVDAIKGSQGSLELTVGELLELINRLISQAAREYAVGIIDGQVNNVTSIRTLVASSRSPWI